MTVAIDEVRIKRALGHVEAIEDVARTIDENDARRATLLGVVGGLLTDMGPVRPIIAAGILDLSEPTVRAWTKEGVLTTVGDESRRPLLDPHRVHEVMHLVRELRAAGRDRNLLEAVWYRLSDHALVERGDLRESLEQMRRGEGQPLTSGQLERRAFP